MKTARFLVALIIGTALVFVVPWATADSPPAEPDVTEAVAPGATAPATAVMPEAAQGVTAPAPETAPQAATAPSGEPAQVPDTGPKPEPASGPKPEPASDPKPEPDTGPKPDPGSDSKPEPGTGPKPEPASGPKPEPASGPKPEPGSAAKPEPGSDPKPKPKPGSDSKPKPDSDSKPKPGSDPKPKPGTDPKPAAPSQAPGGAPPTNGSGGDCFLTSAGLACRGNPPCVVTTAGVTCGTNCVVTSAGLSCPPTGGYVPPGGKVLPGGPVSGGPEGTPQSPVKPEREVKQTAVTGGQGADDIESADAGSLPFTGAPLLPWLVLACGLLVSGLLLRRLTSTTGAVEPVGEAAPRPVQSGVLPRTRALPSRGAIVLQSLVLLALGMLMSRRTRR